MKVSARALENFQTVAYNAAVDGRSLLKWVDDKVVGTTDATVLTDATLIYNLVAGEMVVITAIAWGLNTISDTLHTTIGYTDEASGAGTYTALTHHFETASGDKKTDIAPGHVDFIPVLVVKYSSGARCITMQVTVNDNTAEVTVGWHGFRTGQT